MKLTVIRGLPGSGKTTYANDNFRAVKLQLDMLRIRNGQYIYDRSQVQFLLMRLYHLIGQVLLSRCDVVVVNTFIKKQQINQIKKLADMYGVQFQVITLKNNFGSTLVIPEKDIVRMKNNWQDYSEQKIIGSEYIEHKQIKQKTNAVVINQD